MSRWLSPLMAFCLSFILIAGLAPGLGLALDRQIDFWLVWLGTMFILALPLVYLEIALAKRSKTTALNALPRLTRDADASSHWRVVGWLACAFIPFLAGGVISNISQNSLAVLDLPLPSLAITALAMLAALALSFIPRLLVLALLVLSAIVSLILANVAESHLAAWHMTAFEFKEWGNATILALVASGLGLGLYWQNSLLSVQQQTKASITALPIWIAQLLAVIAFGFFSADMQLPAAGLFVAVIFAGALLLQLAREQMQHREVALVVQLAIVVAAMGIWLVPALPSILTHLLMLLGLLICLVYAIFVGWLMKISHLRKAMNFNSELFYNLWRIAVRIILPLAILLAIVSYLGQMF